MTDALDPTMADSPRTMSEVGKQGKASRWRPMLGIKSLCTILALPLLLALIFAGGSWEWNWDLSWTGLHHKTAWNLIQVALVPFALVLVGSAISNQQKRADAVKKDIENDIADRARQTTTLVAYLETMSDLLTDHDLLHAPQNSPIRATARALTFAVLFEFNNEVKSDVLRFLYEAGLINRYGAHPAIISLERADMSFVFFGKGYLRNANLRGVDFRDAKLRNVDLTGTDLTGADLTGADIHEAILDGVTIVDAVITDAQLTMARSRINVIGNPLKPKHDTPD